MLKWCRKFPRTRKRRVGALGLLWLAVPLVGAAGAEAESPPESVTLDRLLTLPSVLPLESSERGGLTRAEWSSRFAAAEAGVVTAQADLDESLGKLSEMVGKAGNWKVGAPGVQVDPNDNSPVNYGLKQEIRRKREDVVRAERKVRDLIVEANLAGVPENWYKKPESSD
jgi:hypothetical protein